MHLKVSIIIEADKVLQGLSGGRACERKLYTGGDIGATFSLTNGKMLQLRWTRGKGILAEGAAGVVRHEQGRSLWKELQVAWLTMGGRLWPDEAQSWAASRSYWVLWFMAKRAAASRGRKATQWSV